MKHEQGSIDMFDHMLKVNAGLAREFNDIKFTETDITFIKELINGPKKHERKGRTEEKWFLYEEATNLYDMFHIRNLLHQRAYQHKTSNSVEIMLAEALVLADEFIKFEGEDGKLVCMSDTVKDMKAYTLVNDGVIHKIIESDREELKKSKEILNRILRRDLYRCVGEKRFAGGTFGKGDDVINDIKDTLKGTPGFEMIVSRLDDEDFIVVDVVNLNYGNKDRDPIANVNFYSKNERDSAKPRDKDDVSLLLPTVFDEQSVRIYCKNQPDLKDCKVLFEEWVKSTPKNPKNQGTSGSS